MAVPANIELISMSGRKRAVKADPFACGYSLHVRWRRRQQDGQQMGASVTVCCSMQGARGAAEGFYEGSEWCQCVC
jgi:hypothetical protein